MNKERTSPGSRADTVPLSDRELDWATGRELERKDAEIERLLKRLAEVDQLEERLAKIAAHPDTPELIRQYAKKMF